jgi:pentatricopeptide repeat protein
MIAKTADYYKLILPNSAGFSKFQHSQKTFVGNFGTLTLCGIIVILFPQFFRLYLSRGYLDMKTILILFIVGITVVLSTSGFQCGTAEMTSGKMYLQRQDWANAERSFEQEVAKHPDNAEAWYWLGRVRHELKNYKGMNEAFTRALALSKEFEKEITDVRLGTWGQLFNSGVQSYVQSKSVKGDSVAILLKKAVDDFTTAIAIIPDSGSTYTNLGLAYLSMDDFENAIRNFETSLQKENDAGLTMSVGNLYLDRGKSFQNEARNAAGAKKDSLTNLARQNFVKAIERLEAGRAKWPDDGNIVGTLLDAYVASGRVDEAMNTFRQAVERNPDNKLYRYNYGVLLLKAGNHKSAVEQFEAAVAADPTFEDALYNLGITYLQWGAKRRSEAEAATKGDREKKIDKSYEQQFKKGKEALEKLRDIKPGDPDTWEALGQVYANLNMAKAATDAFDKADNLRKGKN